MFVKDLNIDSHRAEVGFLSRIKISTSTGSQNREF